MPLTAADCIAAARENISETSVAEIEPRLSTDMFLIDVRDEAEYRQGHLPGAVHVPRGLLEFRIHPLVERHCVDDNSDTADQHLVVYCGSGGRSALAAQTLQSMGYRNVESLAGGITAWMSAGLPVDSSA